MQKLFKISLVLWIVASIAKIVIFAYFSYEANHIGSNWLYYENHEKTSVFVGLCSILPDESIQYSFCMLKFSTYSDDSLEQKWLNYLPEPNESKFSQLKGFN